METNQIRYPVVDESRSMAVNDKIYVAVGNNLKESKSIIRWALHNSGGKRICIFHVHQPAEKIPIMGTKFPIDQLQTHQVEAFHEIERQDMLQLLNKYNQMCQNSGVSVEVKYIEMGSIEKGIVEFILQHDVRRLVMGAAADKHYSRKMVDLKSRKAIDVCLQAAASCQIQFICKGNIIFTRQGKLDGPNVSVSSLSLPQNTNSYSAQSSLRSTSVSEGEDTTLQVNSPTRDYHIVMSDNRGPRLSPLSLSNFDVEWSGIPPTSPSIDSRLSTCSGEVTDDSGLSKGSEVESEKGAVPGSKANVQNPSPPSVLQARDMNAELYDQLEQAMTEADNSKRDAFEESIRRRKAEKEAIEGKRRVKASENLYAEEFRRRREIEEILEKTKEEHEIIEKVLDEVTKLTEELRMALEQRSFLESQIADSNHAVHELEQKMFSAVKLLQNYKKERDELQLCETSGSSRVVKPKSQSSDPTDDSQVSEGTLAA